MDFSQYGPDIKTIASYVLCTLTQSGGHGIDHTFRVVALCEQIGKAEGANQDILIAAALLHDIARPREKTEGISHEEEGARIAGEFLPGCGMNPGYIPDIVHAIRAHRYRSSLIPQTLEAKILSDADKLDAIGAVGIARTFLTAGEREGDISEGIEHIHEKLLNLAGLMYTDTARDIARERHEFLVNFINRLSAEMKTGIENQIKRE